MSTILLDGSRHDDDFARTARLALSAALAETGTAPEIIPLDGRRIADCSGCFGCWIRTPGECVIRDDAPTVTARLAHAERIVFFSPVVFGGFSPLLKRQIERSIPLLLPFMRVYHGELHHPPRYRRSYRLTGIGLLERPDPEAEDCYRQRLRRLALNFNGTDVGAVTLVRGALPDSAGLSTLLARREAL